MIKLYCIHTTDGTRWSVRHDKHAAVNEAELLSRLYPEEDWVVYFSCYESITDAIYDNVMVCPECNELMQHVVAFFPVPADMEAE